MSTCMTSVLKYMYSEQVSTLLYIIIYMYNVNVIRRADHNVFAAPYCDDLRDFCDVLGTL